MSLTSEQKIHALLFRQPDKNVRQQFRLGSLFDQQAIDPFEPSSADTSEKRLVHRTRIWELHPSYHCSIIGTCLSTTDVRHVLERLNLNGAKALSDHDLHKYGVTLAGQRDAGGKMLQKALDRRHEQDIRRFGRAKSAAELAQLWQEAFDKGDIPGGYWAVLTHPLTGETIQKKAFGEVHMVSHLMGAANRADIRKLRDLEDENSALRAKVERQQAQIRDAVVSRDARINQLSELVARSLNDHIAPTQGLGSRVDEPPGASLEQHLASEAAHRHRIEARLKLAEQRLASERAARQAAELRASDLEIELKDIEVTLGEAVSTAPETDSVCSLKGVTLLYVGGRTGHVAGLRDVARRFSARLLHHDGGIESQVSQIAGLISQSTAVFFPVDCVSHEAMQLVKRLSRQAGKPYVPLRSSGLGSFVAAIRCVATQCRTH